MDFFILNYLVYATYVGGRVVILDMNNDMYIFLDDQDTADLEEYICTSISNNERINDLIDKKVIMTPEKAKITRIDLKKNKLYKKQLPAEAEYDMRTLSSKKEKPSKTNKKDLFVAWYYLFLVSTLFRLGNLNWCMRYLMRKRKGMRPCLAPCEHINKIIHTVNQASKILPYRIGCLEWSIACAFLGFSKNINFDLCIGVQEPPFLAHAWIEYQKVPIDGFFWRKYLYLIFSSEAICQT